MSTVRILPPGVLPPGGTSFTAVCGGGTAYPGGEPGAAAVQLSGRTYIAAPG